MMSASFGTMSREDFFAHMATPYGEFKKSLRGERCFYIEIVCHDGCQREVRAMGVDEEAAFKRACKALFVKKSMVVRWTAKPLGT